jgi:hypothetical protein
MAQASECPERARINRMIADSAQKVRVAEIALDDAKRRRQDLQSYQEALAAARMAGRDAIKALAFHRSQHGC